MTDQTRRLSAEMRQRWRLYPETVTARVWAGEIFQDVLHDLDTADAERDEARENLRSCTEQNIRWENECAKLRNDLADALDTQRGRGPTALGMVVAERNELRADLAQAQATIAAMREALSEISMGTGPYSKDALTHAGNTIEAMKKLALDAREGVPEAIAADHTAKIREPLEAQIAALVAEIRGIAEESCLPDGDGVTVPVALWAEEVIARLGTVAADHTSRIQAEARAEERRRVLEEVRQIVGAAEEGKG